MPTGQTSVSIDNILKFHFSYFQSGTCHKEKQNAYWNIKRIMYRVVYVCVIC